MIYYYSQIVKSFITVKTIMKSKHNHALGGALAVGITAACAACDVPPECAFEPDEKMRQEIKEEIELGGKLTSTVQKMIEASIPIPDAEGHYGKDNAQVVKDVGQTHELLERYFEEDRIMVAWYTNYAEETGETAGAAYIGMYTPTEADDRILALYDKEVLELQSGADHLEHEAAHGVSRMNHSDETSEAAKNEVDNEQKVQTYIKEGDFAYTISTLYRTLRILHIYMENNEINSIRESHELHDDTMSVETGAKIYAELLALEKVSEDEWSKQAAGWFYVNDGDQDPESPYYIEYTWCKGYLDGYGITQEEMESILIESEFYEWRQEYINEAIAELIEDYGEEIREGDETEVQPEYKIAEKRL